MNSEDFRRLEMEEAIIREIGQKLQECRALAEKLPKDYALVQRVLDRSFDRITRWETKYGTR